MRNRSQGLATRIGAWAIGLSGLALVPGAVVYGLFEQATYEEEAKRKAADYAAHAAAKIKQTCDGRSSIIEAECVEDARPEYELAKRDKQREYADLVAQQRSALWTSIMGIAALIGMALSAVGVFLVRQTFRETQKTNEIARRENARSTRRAISAASETIKALAIAERSADATAALVETSKDSAQRQLRAYIVFQVADISLNAGKPISIRVKVTNYGKTPAKNFFFRGCAVARPPGWHWNDEVGSETGHPQMSDVHPSEDRFAPITSDEALSEDNYNAILAGELMVYATGVGNYETVFGTPCETHYTIEFGGADILERTSPRLSEEGNFAT